MEGHRDSLTWRKNWGVTIRSYAVRHGNCVGSHGPTRRKKDYSNSAVGQVTGLINKTLIVVEVCSSILVSEGVGLRFGRFSIATKFQFRIGDRNAIGLVIAKGTIIKVIFIGSWVRNPIGNSFYHAIFNRFRTFRIVVNAVKGLFKLTIRVAEARF